MLLKARAAQNPYGSKPIEPCRVVDHDRLRGSIMAECVQEGVDQGRIGQRPIRQLQIGMSLLRMQRRMWPVAAPDAAVWRGLHDGGKPARVRPRAQWIVADPIGR